MGDNQKEGQYIQMVDETGKPVEGEIEFVEDHCCPKCGTKMEPDPDGAWCPKCEEYWDKETLRDREAEMYDEDECEED